jgi:hypothetical protein
MAAAATSTATANNNNNNNNNSNNVHPNPIVSLMACMMNYLNVSFYEGLFTYNHEQARAILNEIYDRVSNTPVLAPSVKDTEMFYGTVHYLRGVTDTDDPNYASYMREFRRFIVAAAKPAEEAATSSISIITII